MAHPKLFEMEFSKIYRLYVEKVEKKQRTEDELITVITWLTGYNQDQLAKIIKSEISVADFFNQANINRNTALITGVVCGIRVENIEDPLMQKIRYLDKLVDELARKKKIESILR